MEDLTNMFSTIILFLNSIYFTIGIQLKPKCATKQNVNRRDSIVSSCSVHNVNNELFRVRLDWVELLFLLVGEWIYAWNNVEKKTIKEQNNIL